MPQTEPSDTEIIEALRPLLAYGRVLPLHNDSKRPWLRSVVRDASDDHAKIAEWTRTKAGCSWGLRIESDELIVLDCEAPGKGSPAGGRRVLDWIEVDHGQRLPDGPVATTTSGGEHRYYLIPEKYHGRIKNWSGVFPSIDIRVQHGMVAVPPSAGREWIESFTDVDLQELPDWFCDLILEGRAPSNPNPSESGKTNPQPHSIVDRPASIAVNTIVHANIPDRAWFRVRQSKDFWALWSRRKALRDTSNSSYEFCLAKIGYRCGLETAQVATMISAWWTKHGISGKYERLIRRILPDAWTSVAGYVLEYRASQERNRAGKTVNRILAYITAHGTCTPAKVAAALEITNHAAHHALTRMVASGRLTHQQGGSYTLSTDTQQGRTHTDSVYAVNRNTPDSAAPVPDRKPVQAAITPSPAIEPQPHLQEPIAA